VAQENEREIGHLTTLDGGKISGGPLSAGNSNEKYSIGGSGSSREHQSACSWCGLGWSRKTRAVKKTGWENCANRITGSGPGNLILSQKNESPRETEIEQALLIKMNPLVSTLETWQNNHENQKTGEQNFKQAHHDEAQSQIQG
jgi:hypothetical protein